MNKIAFVTVGLLMALPAFAQSPSEAGRAKVEQGFKEMCSVYNKPDSPELKRCVEQKFAALEGKPIPSCLEDGKVFPIGAEYKGRRCAEQVFTAHSPTGSAQLPSGKGEWQPIAAQAPAR